MPALTGFQLVRRVKDLRPGMIVIVMTMFEVNKCEFGAVFPSTPIDGVIRKTIYIFTAGRKNKRIFGHDDSRDYKTNRWQQGLISIKSGKNITEY